MTVSLLQSLRDATATAHEDLHIHPVLNQLAHDTLTIDYYQTALEKFYGFYEPLETLYAQSGSDLLQSFPAGPQMTRLKYDLQRLSVDIDTLPVLSVTDMHFPSEKIIAYLYLREGSNLGGKVISKNLERTLGLQPGIDNHFFWGHGQATGQYWRHFMATLNTLSSSLNTTDVAQHGADLFTCLSTWLTQPEALKHVA